MINHGIELNHYRCPLCSSGKLTHLCRDASRHQSARDYIRCAACRLVFVPPEQHLAPETELSRYERHENNPEDPAYRAFLNRMFEPMNRKLSAPSRGLDFGSGPGPTLHLMFEEAGHSMAIYDLYYATDESVFDDRYDFITTTETAEHLREPRRELDRLWGCLKPAGWLGIMTRLIPETESFIDWHYKNDDTHIVFYDRKTFRWLGERWDAELEFKKNDVMLFRKRR